MVKVLVKNQYCNFLHEYVLNRPSNRKFITNSTWDWDELINTVKFVHTVPAKVEPPVRKKLEEYM